MVVDDGIEMGGWVGLGLGGLIGFAGLGGLRMLGLWLGLMGSGVLCLGLQVLDQGGSHG